MVKIRPFKTCDTRTPEIVCLTKTMKWSKQEAMNISQSPKWIGWLTKTISADFWWMPEPQTSLLSHGPHQLAMCALLLWISTKMCGPASVLCFCLLG